MPNMSPKDADQCIRAAFDDATNRIRTDATFTGTVTVALDQTSDSVAIGDGVTLFTGTNVGPAHAQDVNVVQSVLPTGASTSAAQTAAQVSLSSIDSKLTAPITVKQATAVAGTITQAAVSVGTSAVRVTVSGSAPSATRSLMTVTPDSASTAKFYIGSATVTSSGGTRGMPIIPGETIAFVQDAGDYYIISDTAAQTVYILEQA